MSAVSDLTPQMQGYVGDFMDPNNLGWLTYVMYFHPANFNTDIVSTDGSGFRYTVARGKRYSPATLNRGAVRLLVGSSTVFGTGATADRHTLASRLTENDSRDELWVNVGGRAFNSIQEFVHFSLYRHHLPPIKEVVIFSGLNDLVLSRLPSQLRGEHGGFFFSREFFDRLTTKKASGFSSWFKKDSKEVVQDEGVLPFDEQLQYTADLILRHLDSWRIVCAAIGARLTYVLQPLADWVRPRGSNEEQVIFAELDHQGSFRETYRDVCAVETHKAFVERLQPGVAAMGVNFIDFTPVLAKAALPDQWLFVDRIHFTDEGSDVVAKLLLRELNQGELV